MADSDAYKDPLEMDPFGSEEPTGSTDPAATSGGAAWSDPNGLPDLADLTGAEPVEASAFAPLENQSVPLTSAPFIDEVDFAPRAATTRHGFETPLQASRRERREWRRREQRNTLWNALTVIVWLAMACAVMAFVSIYHNPGSPINPFRHAQPTLVAAVVLPSPTATPRPSPTSVVAATALPTDIPTTAPATDTPTLVPTETPLPGPSPTPTIYSVYPYILRGDVKVIPAATFPDHDTCKLWVAGQVYDLQGTPMTGVTVMLGGYLNKTLTLLSLTGTALQYGPAGYEFTLADAPVKSKQAVWVMLFNQSMAPLSNKIYFDTVDDCQQNLILINFRQIR